jgi:DNA-binding beta-propeller fold protein YncE
VQASTTFAQSYRLIKKVPVNNIVYATVDHKKNIYVADEGGNVVVYDSTAKKLNTYSPEKLGVITSMVATQSLQLFLFYQDFQEYVILDRFLNERVRHSISLEEISYIKVATLASDNNIWIFDEGDMSIKKYNPKINKIITQTSLDLSLGAKFDKVVHLQEHNNFLYLVDKTSGIWVFDNLGNLKKRLSYPNLYNFSFVDKYLYWLDPQGMNQINLYDNQKRKISLDYIPLLQKNYLCTPFLTSSLLFIITPSFLLIYK